MEAGVNLHKGEVFTFDFLGAFASAPTLLLLTGMCHMLIFQKLKFIFFIILLMWAYVYGEV